MLYHTDSVCCIQKKTGRFIHLFFRGLSMSESLANIEALMNICVNGMEIMGLAGGGSMLLTCFIPHACGLPGYTLKILSASIAMIVAGLAMPNIVNSLASYGDAGIIAGYCSV
jgi:hypothetical protein